MSIADLKARLHDVPGIETLTMNIEAGGIILRWTGYNVAVGASASDSDIEVSVRDAIKTPPAIRAASSPQPAIPAASPAQPTVTPAMTTPGTAATSIKDMMAAHVQTMANIHEAQLRLLEASLNRQATAVSTAVNTMAAGIDGQTDDFLAMIGQFTNGAPV